MKCAKISVDPTAGRNPIIHFSITHQGPMKMERGLTFDLKSTELSMKHNTSRISSDRKNIFVKGSTRWPGTKTINYIARRYGMLIPISYSPRRLRITRVEYHLRVVLRSGTLNASSHNLGREGGSSFCATSARINRQLLQQLVSGGEEDARCTVFQVWAPFFIRYTQLLGVF